MAPVWWLLLGAFSVGVAHAAPRELSTEELITKPRPGEEYVHIQTSSQDKVDLLDKAFTTSHRNPELSKSNRSQDFETSHKFPQQVERAGRSLSLAEQRAGSSGGEGTTQEPPLERVVTRTSVKMSKSKKVQKSSVKVARDGFLDIKAEEGVIDERANADEEEREIMKKKFLKSEKEGLSSSELLPPVRFNVPFEDEEKEISLDTSHLIIPNPVIATTQEPPITTFNYKNVYDKSRKSAEHGQDKYKYETVSSESIKTAESKTITAKKDTKQEKKERYKEESGFYLLPVNKQQPKSKEDNYDFVDVEEKVLVPAGSSPSQSSRINIKKGPNGQEYEYEYVYYYYDDDDEGQAGGSAPKEGKAVASTTERVFNGHDGPSKEDLEQNSLQSTSTSGNRYLPTETPRLPAKPSTKIQGEVPEEVQDETSGQNFVAKTSRGGSNGSSRFASSRQPEPNNNEVYPSSGRTQSRSRGRGAPEEDIPPIGEERLPANTRFPPRSRANGVPATSPQPQDAPPRPRGREGSNQPRLRIPNLGLLDSSSFRTHASDASVEDDSELQRKAVARGQATEPSQRRGTRPTTTGAADAEDPPVATRRPAIRRPVEDRRVRPVAEEEEHAEEEKRSKTGVEEGKTGERVLKVPQEEVEKRGKVPLEEENVRTSKIPLEGEEVKRPYESLEEVNFEEEQRQRGPVEEPALTRETQTTRESDAEEGVFKKPQDESTAEQSKSDQTRNPDGRTRVSATEDPSVMGLTSTMMEKVALDLYAILQQAQNENIRTNFIDANSTDVTTALEGQTEFSTDGDGYTAEPSSTTTTTTTTPTTTTTTTTTPAPTPTATTTTAAPTQAPGRGRYRGRVANGSKGRPKVSTTSTTEAPEEVTSPKTRGRFQPSHGTRGSSLTFARKPTKAPVKEQSPEEAPVSVDTPRAAPERGFGERPRSRFRTSGKVTTTAPSTAAPPAPASAAAGTRTSSLDRFNSRRRGGVRTALPASEAHAEEERQEPHQETGGLAEESTPTAPIRPARPRIGGSVRPLRPGPRAPQLLPQRAHPGSTASTTTSPVEHDDIEKEIPESEVHGPQPNEEVQEAQTTPPGDALTRLKSRPRLRIGGNTNHPRAPTPQPPAPLQSRRKLVSSLLPKRKPTEEKPVERVEEAEERAVQEEIPVEEEPPSAPVEPSSTTLEPETKGLSGLLAGRRRNLNRRPGTIYSRAQPVEA